MIAPPGGSGPDTIDLSGPWSVRADPNDAGDTAFWCVLDWLDRFGTIDLPAPPESLAAAQRYGPAWLGRSVRLPAAWTAPTAAGRIRLRLEPGDPGTRAWVNGIEVDPEPDPAATAPASGGVAFDLSAVLRDDPAAWGATPAEGETLLAVRVADVKAQRLTAGRLSLTRG